MEGNYADVIVNILSGQLDRTFQYIIPERLSGRIKPGTPVRIPFGAGDRVIRGYVVEVTDECTYEKEKLKYILDVDEGSLEVESRLIELAAWLREQYASTMLQALRTVLPVKQRIKEKQKKTLLLKCEREKGEKLLSEYEKGKRYKTRARLLRELLKEGALPWELVTGKLGVSAGVIKAMEEQGILEVAARQIYRTPKLAARGEKQKPKLTGQQQKVVDTVKADLDAGAKKTYLLHGVTGSGKTEVYMELISHVVAAGRQAIVLIPEIALTYQTVMRFRARFGERVSFINSRLSDGERYDQFLRAKRGEVDVMIGPRSALFTPFAHVGMIIIDEEHESSYKSEASPRYHARETAIKRAALEGASVLLGSATPSVEAYAAAKEGRYTLLRLEKRVEQRSLPRVYTVDMREELRAGNRSIFSDVLKELMEDRLKKGQQTMLFLNRRGYAGFLSCRACGYVVKCPHCDVSLARHRGGRLMCHYCGYSAPDISVCPECGFPHMGGFRAGTQQVEELVGREFPGARLLRMDMDTTKKKGGHEQILQAFAEREADILIGTQMIVKGHDFPGVTLVGVLAADMSLHVGDFRSSERTFQLLTQAAGRAGRGEEAGEVVIQTYSPEHYALVCAARQDYERFFTEEMAYRSLMDYPPAAHMLAIHLSARELPLLETAAAYLKKYGDYIGASYAVRIIGPADAPISKINDIYKKLIYLKHPDYQVLVHIKNELERYLAINEGFKPIYVQFDFNPMNMM